MYNIDQLNDKLLSELKEIAETLNISVGTSKSQLFKAKAYLKKTIETKLKTQIYA